MRIARGWGRHWRGSGLIIDIKNLLRLRLLLVLQPLNIVSIVQDLLAGPEGLGSLGEPRS